MNVPTDRKYAETHEWFRIDGDIVTMGITQYAADELTDITYVGLPDVGTTVAAGDPISEVESVKATSEILSAVGGQVTEVNTELSDRPELINDDAFEEGWMVKIRADSTEPLTALLDAKGYTAFVQSAG